MSDVGNDFKASVNFMLGFGVFMGCILYTGEYFHVRPRLNSKYLQPARQNITAAKTLNRFNFSSDSEDMVRLCNETDSLIREAYSFGAFSAREAISKKAFKLGKEANEKAKTAFGRTGGPLDLRKLNVPFVSPGIPTNGAGYAKTLALPISKEVQNKAPGNQNNAPPRIRGLI